MTNPTSYTATFTLTTDENNITTPSLTFDPLVDPDDDNAPDIYGFMAECALEFLRQANVIDENNEWTSEAAADSVELNLSADANKGTVH